jgi:cell division septation protein DedD
MKINVVKYIPELLYRHDCVIIPGFGGFIGNYSPARINPVYHTFYPPCKSLLFNIHLKQNDGLLASCISHAEHIPYEHAMEEISRMLFDWHRALENGQELIIEKVGKIVKETDGILQFEQDLSMNYLPDAFGLTTLVSPAIRRPGMQDRLGKKLDRYAYASPGKSRKLTRTLRWAAILALPLGLAVYFSITNMDRIRSFNQNYTGFLFSGSNKAQEKKVASHWIVLPSEKKINAAPKAAAVQPASVQVIQEVKPEVRENTEPAVKNPYAIIVGAFRFRDNADNLVAKLKQEGYDAGIFDTTTTGLFRVCLGSFVNRDEALAQLAVVRANNYSSAWLLAK